MVKNTLKQNWLKIGFLFIFFLTPWLASAYYDPFGPGTKYNPYYFEEYKDPFEKQMEDYNRKTKENRDEENNLKGQYGISNYYSCRNSSCAAGGDYGNPSTEAICLLQVKSCLERNRMREEHAQKMKEIEELKKVVCPTYSQNINNSCVCINGYIKKGDLCISADESCRASYGENSEWISTGCKCKDGYEWYFNSGSTSCVKIQPTSAPAPTINQANGITAENPPADLIKENKESIKIDNNEKPANKDESESKKDGSADQNDISMINASTSDDSISDQNKKDDSQNNNSGVTKDKVISRIKTTIGGFFKRLFAGILSLFHK